MKLNNISIGSLRLCKVAQHFEYEVLLLQCLLKYDARKGVIFTAECLFDQKLEETVQDHSLLSRMDMSLIQRTAQRKPSL